MYGTWLCCDIPNISGSLESRRCAAPGGQGLCRPLPFSGGGGPDIVAEVAPSRPVPSFNGCAVTQPYALTDGRFYATFRIPGRVQSNLVVLDSSSLLVREQEGLEWASDFAHPAVCNYFRTVTNIDVQTQKIARPILRLMTDTQVASVEPAVQCIYDLVWFGSQRHRIHVCCTASSPYVGTGQAGGDPAGCPVWCAGKWWWVQSALRYMRRTTTYGEPPATAPGPLPPPMVTWPDRQTRPWPK